MKKINLRGVSETLNERELKDVRGGTVFEMNRNEEADLAGGGGGTSDPCPPPKRPCNGPAGTFTNGGICCLGPWGPHGIFGRYCYAELQGLNKCP